MLSNNGFKVKFYFQVKKSEQLEEIYGYRLDIVGV